jgi:hypothetical protein
MALGVGATFAVMWFFDLDEADIIAVVRRLPGWVVSLIAAIPEGTPQLVLMLPGLLLVVGGMRIVRVGRRNLVTTYAAEEPHAFRDTILYLRPFAADAAPIRLPPNPMAAMFPLLDGRSRALLRFTVHDVVRYEELLSYAFRRVGTLIAIGDPRESLPLLGATRVYAGAASPSDSAGEAGWKAEVRRQIERARLVLLHIGDTENLRWEIERAVASAQPDRVVLCVAPIGKETWKSRTMSRALRAQVHYAWTQFRQAHENAFPLGLPESIGDARFVRFRADWTPEPIPPVQQSVFWFARGRRRAPGIDSADGALTWLTWLLVPEPLRRRLARSAVNYVTFVAALLTLMLVLVPAVVSLVSAIF